ncbi:hypothetical protein KUTeg_008754 [Tegillarca granosa]|uniref:Uncharacterized protein n=1 Tax=Tegillarca granosa TaxID=220873 RepID=A0ABQ9F9Y7_TEGGR|nr:hypothetical protein KUTeg_008754 [Tegillarca granosa]
MLLSVIGDSPEFHPKEWSKLSFQTAILETVNRAEECLVMYMQPGSGAMIGTLVENTLKNHSIGVDRFLTFRYRKTENDTFNNPMDTGLCLYSHKLMSVCDLRSSRSVMKRKIPKPDHESISNIMFEIEKYIHEVGRIEIEFVREVDKVPVVLVLAEGDMTSIHHVLEAVKIDTIVYIIKGSGKAADVIADYLNDQNSLEESVAKHFGLAFLKEEEKLKQLKQYLNEIIEKYRWKITVFDINKEEPKVLADMISDSVSSLWKLDPTKQFEDGYMWIPNIYIPLAYRYIQLHGEFGSHKASSLLEQAFRVSANIVKRLLDNGTSLRKIYEQEQDTYVYSPTIKETPVKSPLSSFTAVSSRKEDKVNNYRRRLQFLRERASKGYMSEELLSELFMFEFLLSNDHEMADIFWHRCPNQLMTALVMSAFLKKKAKVELELRKRRLVDDDNDEFTTEERFTEDPVDEEFRILSEPVNVMGLEITPLEFAFNNERLDFLSHSTCQRYLLTQWTAKNKKAVNCMEQVWKFMAAPRTKFYVSYVFFFLAMICCSIFTLTDVNLITSFSEISKYQIAFTIWIVGDLFEEFVVETKDLLSFLRILAIIIIGVGVGYHANIFPNFSPLFYDDWGERWMDARIFSIIAMPYWQIYGDPNLNDLENEAISYCESKNITSDCKMDFSVPLTSFVFMMFGNVLLMNLVIAMFSNRFSAVENQREGEMIEIMISRDNSKGAVITNRKKDILVTKDTENILDKSSFREFEITWSEKEMQVESRTYTGNAKDEEGKNKKDLLNIYKVIFKVKAKCDVHLAFFKKSENEKSLHELAQDDFEMMKVVIGGSANTKTWISYTNCRKVNDSREIKKSTPLNDISNSEQQKTSRFSKNSEPFWISWGEMMGEETVVKVGKGEDVDIKPILKGQLPPFKVEFIGVSTSEQSEGNWTFDTGKTIFTPKEFNYKLVSPVIMEQFRKTITFQVKAKSDAHIALCHKLPSRCDKNMYEIVLDHNKTSFIRNLSHDKNNKKILAKRDGCCLNEKTYTTFWISWADGKIKVGKSTLYNEEILSCEYGYEYPVVYLAVSTGPESYGYWRFDEDIIFNAVKHMKTSLPSEIQEMQRKIFNINDTRQTIWQYNNDEVKKKRMKLKWRRSQEQLSAVCINSLQNEMSNNRSETE